MADISAKEAGQTEEKEEDTTTAVTPSQDASPPASAKKKKSPPGSAKAEKKGAAGGKGNKPKKGGEKKKEVPVEEPKPEEPEKPQEDGLAEGLFPIFLASKTQELFHCRTDEDVTAENPIKIITKEEILEDLKTRAAVCDFHPFKQQIVDFPEDEILVVYDPDYKYGQNFYIALTVDAKENILNPPEEEQEGAAEEEEEVIIYKYIPPEPKEWVTFGSEKEIEEESVIETRQKIKVSCKRKRREFGAPYKFKDRNVADAKDGFIECTSFEDPSFSLKRVELDKSIQAIPHFTERGAQTNWRYPRNNNTQYYPREFTESEKEERANSTELHDFVVSVTPRFELALQQNEIMNVFYIDWLHLGDPTSTFGTKTDNHLKEYQSFTDLQFSKDRTITCIQWHPTLKGVVAVSVAERMTFDERIDNAARVIMTPSLILIWSFTDPIHPQLLLEAPDAILSFQFSPSDSAIVAGGCMNGQVVLWDISAHMERLKQPRSGRTSKLKDVLPGFEDPNALKTPIVRYCAVSNIEQSHKAPITDLQWIPDHLELNRMGVPLENKQQQCVQLMTCATDHHVLVWDTRSKTGGNQPKDDDKGPKNPMGVPNTFRHLDLSWKPILKIFFAKSEPGGNHAPSKFTIQERQGDRAALYAGEDNKEKDPTSTAAGGFSGPTRGSAKDQKTLITVKTHLYVGTEDGEVVYCDWMPAKDQDTGKIQTSKPDYYHSIHDGPINTMQRSPFFKTVVLCVGGWTFSLWKEGVNSGPILYSAASGVRLTCGHWSPTRPGVFFISKTDGSVEIWDLLDKTHEPFLVQSVCSSPINTIYPYQVTHKQQLMAVGDCAGTLHILEIPWSLRHATHNEMTSVSNYIEREVKRRHFVVGRWNMREEEKREIEAEAKRKAGIAPDVQPTDEQIEAKMKQEYLAYLEEENAFLRELGIRTEEGEPLPELD